MIKRKVWNKKELSFEEIKIIRKFVFQRKELKEISQITGVTSHIFYRLMRERKWIRARERYWLFLCKYAYKNRMSIAKIAKKIGISQWVLCRIKKKNKIKTKMFSPPNKRITKEIEEKMVELYIKNKYKTTKQIAVDFGFKTQKTVSDVLKKYNIEAKTQADYTDYNTKYFEKINTHDKAYILGLLLTDGYVIKKYEGFGIDLIYSDRKILDNIKKRMGPSCVVKDIKCKGKKKFCNKIINVNNRVRLLCYSPKMVRDLQKNSMVVRKTKVLKFPNISQRLYSSFFRGIIDGDGTVGTNSQTKHPWCQFVCYNKKFIKDSERVLTNSGFNIGTSFNEIPTLYVKGGKKEILRFLKWMYRYKKDLYLERKYERFTKM